MKSKLLIFAIFTLISTICSAQQRRALLIGIANYPSESGWRTIHSDTDVKLLKDLLSPTYEVKSLIDSQATYNNITKKLDELSVLTSKGDTILLLFSCHGQQMLGSDEPDSLDEALIPYDAISKYSNKYKGENHLRDNELSNKIDKIRNRAGKNGLVVVLLDACHSGDSFRGDNENEQNYRGGYPVFGERAECIVPRQKELKSIVNLPASDALADVIYIGACQSYQINEEVITQNNTWCGSLTLAFKDSFEKFGFLNLNKLCESIRTKILESHRTTRQCPEFASTIPNLINTTESLPIYNCNACDENFNSQEDFESHITESHNDDHSYWLIAFAFFCSICLFNVFLWMKKKK